MLRCITLTVVGIVGCTPSHIQSRYQNRVENIELRYSNSMKKLNELEADALAGIATVRAQLVEVGPRSAPVRRQWDDYGLRQLRGKCNLYDGETSAKCRKEHSDRYVAKLTEVYWAADFQWALDKLDPETMDIESLLAYSHNMRLGSLIAEQEAEVRRIVAEVRTSLNNERTSAYDDAIAERDAAVAAHNQRVLLALAQGMQAAGRTMQRQPAQASTTTWTTQPPMTASPSGRECSSDFACGIGYRCVKANYSATGYCAKAVNEYGVQTFELPSMDSIFIKVPSGADCKFDTQCPIGFRCDAESGACLR